MTSAILDNTPQPEVLRTDLCGGVLMTVTAVYAMPDKILHSIFVLLKFPLPVKYIHISIFAWT